MGRKTKIFEKYKLDKDQKPREKLSFSILNDADKGKTSLDLEGQSEIEIEIFINQLKIYINMLSDEAKKKEDKLS